MSSSRRLMLTGALNVRDLGGYTTREGRQTRSGCFLRADGLHNLTTKDISKLREYGVALAVDLRSQTEKSEKPSRLLHQEGIRVEGIDLLGASRFQLFNEHDLTSMSELYLSMLDECGAAIAQVFKLLVANVGQVSLFHCTAGKDRTGIVAMLLLQLSGVADADIISDYAESEENLRAVSQLIIRELLDAGKEVADFLFESKSEQMERTLKHLYTSYGDAREYLLHVGLEVSELEVLRRALLV